MRFKKFKKAEVSKSYITWSKISSHIKYKLMNKQIKIDLKNIIDLVLDDAGISGFDTSQVNLTIPYDLLDAVSGDTLSLLIDKRRFHIRLPEMQIVRNKQQKIDYDNTYPHRWSKAQWIKYIEKLYWDHYGFKSLELNLRGSEGQVRKGKNFTIINNLIKTILGIEAFDANHKSVVEYLNWVFEKKSDKHSLTLPLICCNGFLQEWIVGKMKKKSKSKLSNKWR